MINVKMIIHKADLKNSIYFDSCHSHLWRTIAHLWRTKARESGNPDKLRAMDCPVKPGNDKKVVFGGCNKTIINLFVIIPLMLLSCVYDTTDPYYYDELYKKEYGYCKAFLNTYFLFRDSLPENLDAFTAPESLYLCVNDLFTEYVEKGDAPDFKDYSNTKTENKNIGIEIDSVGMGVVITYVYPNSPASEKQLQRGDTITAIDSISLAGVSMTTVNTYFEETGDTSKTLELKRDSTWLLTIGFKEYALPSVYVDSIVYDGSDTMIIAYIYIAAFLDISMNNKSTADEVKEALTNTQSAAYTILDLRDNLGGTLSQSVNVASNFLPDNGEIVKIKEWVDTSITSVGYVKDSILIDADDVDFGGRTFYLLVNDSTAGASEILVSCIQENAVNYKIVGIKTYGLGLAQILAETPDSGIAKVTNAEIFSITGGSYNCVGIDPDIIVPVGQDALEAALNDLNANIVSQNINTINRIKELREKHRTRNRKPLCIKWINE